MDTKSSPENKSFSTKKKKNRRQRSKYPALDKSLNLKTRTHLIDYDYLHKLSPEELQWLNDFTEEEINSSVNKNPAKNKFNRTRKKVKECYDRNNARNRDVLTQQHATKRIKYLDDVVKKSYDPEGQLMAKIELQRLGVIDIEGKKIRRRKKANA